MDKCITQQMIDLDRLIITVSMSKDQHFRANIIKKETAKEAKEMMNNNLKYNSKMTISKANYYSKWINNIIMMEPLIMMMNHLRCSLLMKITKTNKFMRINKA